MESISISRKNPFVLLEKESVEMLLKEYDLPLQIEEKVITFNGGEEFGLMKGKTLGNFHIGLLRMPIIHDQPDNTIIQVAKLALLMNSCRTGKITISGTISNPKEGEVKGTEKKVEIESDFFNHHFSKFLHTLISQGNEDFYTNHINVQTPEPDESDQPEPDAFGLIVPHGYKKHYQFGDFVFMEDWTEEELKAIIKYEESNIGRLMNEYALIGRRLYFILNRLNDYNLFKDCTKTKVYSFLYDWGVLHGIFNDKGKGFTGTIGKEKFAEIRNRINAYRRKANELNLEDNGNYYRVKEED